MKKFIILALVLLIALVACDRYEHKIFEDNSIETMMSSFSDSLNIASPDSLSTIMNFYHEDYLNDAYSKSDMSLKFIEYLFDYENLSASIDGYFQDLSIHWTLYGTPSNDGKEIVEIETFSDFLVYENSNYYFIGNQVSPPAYDETKAMVVAQFSSATTCGNCPRAANKLAEMTRTYGDQFIYLEYLYDGPDVAHNFVPFVSYYGMNSQPSTMFQGQYVASGGSSEVIESYEAKYELSAQTEKIIDINVSSINYTATNLTATVSIQNIENLPQENLTLKSAILIPHSDYEYHSTHQELHNVVIATSSLKLDSRNVDITIDSTIDLESGMKLVVWIQTLTPNYNPETCKIHDAKVTTLE